MSPCSATCGTGLATLTTGGAVTLVPCEVRECDVYSDWSMGECSATCGFGTRIASRECLQGECAEELIREFPCVGPCPLYGEWTESSCSVTCGSGTIIARRECLAGLCEDVDLMK